MVSNKCSFNDIKSPTYTNQKSMGFHLRGGGVRQCFNLTNFVILFTLVGEGSQKGDFYLSSVSLTKFAIVLEKFIKFPISQISKKENKLKTNIKISERRVLMRRSFFNGC